VTTGAAGVAPAPFGLVMVAVLLMVVPGVARSGNGCIVNNRYGTAGGDANAGDVERGPGELLVAPAGKLTTVKFVRLASMASVTETPLAAAPLLSFSVMVYCRTSPAI